MVRRKAQKTTTPGAGHQQVSGQDGKEPPVAAEPTDSNAGIGAAFKDEESRLPHTASAAPMNGATVLKELFKPEKVAEEGSEALRQADSGNQGPMTNMPISPAGLPSLPDSQQPTQQQPDLWEGSQSTGGGVGRVQAMMQAGGAHASGADQHTQGTDAGLAGQQPADHVGQVEQRDTSSAATMLHTQIGQETGQKPSDGHDAATLQAQQQDLAGPSVSTGQKRPRRAAASKRRTPEDMLYEHVGGSDLPGIEEGNVVLPGVHNPGGLLHTSGGGNSDSEGTKSEAAMETEDEDDVDEQEDTDADSSGESGSVKRRRIRPSRGRGRARGANSTRIAPASTGRGAHEAAAAAAAAPGSPPVPAMPGGRASRGRTPGGGGRGQRSQRYTGVYNQACGRWRAQFCHGGMVHQLGMYDTEEQAAQAWDRVSWVYRERKADLNLPELVHEYDNPAERAQVREQMDDRMSIYKPRGKNAKADAERNRVFGSGGARVGQGAPAPSSPKAKATGRAGATRKVPNTFIPHADRSHRVSGAGTDTPLGEFSEAGSALPSENEAGARGGSSKAKGGQGSKSKRGGANSKLSLFDLGDAAAILDEQEREEEREEAEEEEEEQQGAVNKKPRAQRTRTKHPNTSLKQLSGADAAGAGAGAEPAQQHQLAGGSLGMDVDGKPLPGTPGMYDAQMAGMAGAGVMAPSGLVLPGMAGSMGRDDLGLMGCVPGLGLPSPNLSGGLGMGAPHTFSPPGAMNSCAVWPGTMPGMPGYAMPAFTTNTAGYGAHAAVPSPASQAFPPFPQPNLMLPFGGAFGACVMPPFGAGPSPMGTSMGASLGGGGLGLSGGSSGGSSSLGGMTGSPPECGMNQSQQQQGSSAMAVSPAGFMPQSVSSSMPLVPSSLGGVPHSKPSAGLPSSTEGSAPSAMQLPEGVSSLPATTAAPAATAGMPQHAQQQQQQQLQLTPQQQAQQLQLHIALQQQQQQRMTHTQQQQQQELQRALQLQQGRQQQSLVPTQLPHQPQHHHHHMQLQWMQQQQLWAAQQQQQQQAMWMQQQQQQLHQFPPLPKNHTFAATSTKFPNVRQLLPKEGGQWVGLREGPFYLHIMSRHDQEDEAGRQLAQSNPAPPSFFVPASMPPPMALPITHHHPSTAPIHQDPSNMASNHQGVPQSAALPSPQTYSCAYSLNFNPVGLAAQPNGQTHTFQQRPGSPFLNDLASPSGLLGFGLPAQPIPVDGSAAVPFSPDHFLNFPPVAAPPSTTTPAIAPNMRTPPAMTATIPKPSSALPASPAPQQPTPQQDHSTPPRVLPATQRPAPGQLSAPASTRARAGGAVGVKAAEEAGEQGMNVLGANALNSPNADGNEDFARLIGLLGVPTPTHQQQPHSNELSPSKPGLQHSLSSSQLSVGTGGVDLAGMQALSNPQQQQQIQQLLRAQQLMQQQQSQQQQAQQSPRARMNRTAPPPLDLNAILAASQPQPYTERQLLHVHSPPAPHSAAASAPGTPPALQQQQQGQRQQGSVNEAPQPEMMPAANLEGQAAPGPGGLLPEGRNLEQLPVLSADASRDSCGMAFPTQAASHVKAGDEGGRVEGQHQGGTHGGTVHKGPTGGQQGGSPNRTPGSSSLHEAGTPCPTSSHSLISTPAPSLPSPHSKAVQPLQYLGTQGAPALTPAAAGAAAAGGQQQ